MEAQKQVMGQSGRTNWKLTAELWAFTAVKSPMIFFVRPRVIGYDGDTFTTLVKLNRRNRNPFGSMYFGSLSTGAEMLPGILSVLVSRELNVRAAFSVREFRGQFISKADSDVVFHCEEGSVIRDMMHRSSVFGEGQQGDITVSAHKRSKEPGRLFGTEVAQFTMVFYIKALG